MSLGPGDEGWESFSLFEQYGGKLSSTSRGVGHSPTRTSRMRTNIVKLSCYLNREADRSRATIVRLPVECDTLGEAIPKIHMRLDLDKKIAYAAELFLPDGTKIKSFPELVEASEKNHAIIVGCGEAFDPTTIPYDILEAYLHGGGPKALHRVTQELRAKQQQYAHEKADTIRASGHGVYPNSSAVVTAREGTLEMNRQVAAQMRHEYMEQLMYRAEQQKLLTQAVQRNSTMLKAEAQAAKERRAVMDAERREKIVAEKEEARELFEAKRSKIKSLVKSKHQNVRKQYVTRHKAKGTAGGLTSSLAGKGDQWGAVEQYAHADV